MVSCKQNERQKLFPHPPASTLPLLAEEWPARTLADVTRYSYQMLTICYYFMLQFGIIQGPFSFYEALTTPTTTHIMLVEIPYIAPRLTTNYSLYSIIRRGSVSRGESFKIKSKYMNAPTIRRGRSPRCGSRSLSPEHEQTQTTQQLNLCFLGLT